MSLDPQAPEGARIAFFGTPEMAAQHLRAMLAAGWRPTIVITQPDRPAGRGKRLKPPVVKQVALEEGLELWQPERIRKRATIEQYAALELDAAIVVAYGQILAERMLEQPRSGTYNVHASLLPRWRGPAPIEWALLAGDTSTGVSVQRMVRRLDEGGIVASRQLPIEPRDDRARLHDKLAQAGGALLVETLPAILAGTAQATPQPSEGITYAPIPTREEAYLDPARMSAVEIDRRIRALHANPGTWVRVELAGGEVERLKLLETEPVGEAENAQLQVARPQPGERIRHPAVAHELVVACREGALRIRACQPPSKQPMEAKAYLAAHPVLAIHPPEGR